MEDETKFKYIDSDDKSYSNSYDRAVQLEIAHQLKRIADRMEAWQCEGALGTFECNSKK